MLYMEKKINMGNFEASNYGMASHENPLHTSGISCQPKGSSWFVLSYKYLSHNFVIASIILTFFPF